MEPLDYDHDVFTRPNTEADKSMAVRFFMGAVQDDVKTAQEGRPIFVDTPFVEMRVRGDRNNVINRPVRDSDKKRFPAVWAAFTANGDAAAQGTPLTQWPVMSTAMIEEMRYLGFTTVEHIADAQDHVLSRVTGLRSIQEKAKRYLEIAKEGSGLTKLEQQLAESQAQHAAALEMNKQLSAKLDVVLAQMAAKEELKVTPAAKR